MGLKIRFQPVVLAENRRRWVDKYASRQTIDDKSVARADYFGGVRNVNQQRDA